MKRQLIPYMLEFATKGISFLVSALFIIYLALDEYGDYSLIRSKMLLFGTLLLAGLQTASFRFANRTSSDKKEYLLFSISVFSFLTICCYMIVLLFELRIMNEDYDLILITLIFCTSISLYYAAFHKAQEHVVKGYFFVFLQAALFLLINGMLLLTDMFNFEHMLWSLMFAQLAVNVPLLIVLISQSIKSWQFITIEKTKCWLTVSGTFLLSGLLNMIYFNGLLIGFSWYFSEDLVGSLGIAVLLAVNAGVFKEIAIAMYLPRIISSFNQQNADVFPPLMKSILLGAIPVLLLIVAVMLSANMLQFYLPEKITDETLLFTYILLTGQILMAVYQPMIRLLGAINLHHTMLKISLIGSSLLLVAMYLTGYYQTYIWMISSVPVLALLITIFTIIKTKQYVFKTPS